MTEYIVSARKYRPDTFESLVGQDNIARTLKNSIVRGQLAHAYLFCGPRGVGKTSTARIFAKTINCSDPTPEMEPCGRCESCISFAEGRSYCIHELDAASNNGVDDIKALMEQVRIPPQVGKYSVYIIDEVHMLSQSAFNAFLKTLEEPPAHAIFILATTEKHKILPTILSRCQTYDFNRISVADIVRNLRHIAESENVSIDDESLHIIAGKADGAMRDALTIFDQTVAFCGTEVRYQDVLNNLNVLDYEHCFNLVDDFLAGDYPAALLKFDRILSKGFNALHFVAALSSHFRDLIVSRSSGLDALLELPDSLKKRYREQSERCPLQFLYECLNITTQCEAGYRMSVNPRLHIEFALMKLCLLQHPFQASSAAVPQVQPTMSRMQPAEQKSEAGSRADTAPPASETVPATASQAEAVPQHQPEQTEPAKPQEAAAPARTRRRQPAKTASALSIRSMMNEAGSTDSPEAGAVLSGTESDLLPSDDHIRNKWKELVVTYASKPRLANTLSSTKLEFSESEGSKLVVFSVQNESQKKWIEEKLLRELEGTLQRLAGSSRVRLRVSVVPDDAVNTVPYTQSEKAKDLMARNDEVRNLISDFDLDVK